MNAVHILPPFFFCKIQFKITLQQLPSLTVSLLQDSLTKAYMNFSSTPLFSYMPCPYPYIGIQDNNKFFNYPLCGVCIYTAKLASVSSHTRWYFCSAINCVSHASFHVFTVALLRIECIRVAMLCHWVTGHWRYEWLPRVTEPSNNDTHSSSSSVTTPNTKIPSKRGVTASYINCQRLSLLHSSTKQITWRLLLRLDGALDCCESLSLSLWPQRTQWQSLLLPAGRRPWAHTLRQFVCIQRTANQCLYLVVIRRNIL